MFVEKFRRENEFAFEGIEFSDFSVCEASLQIPAMHVRPNITVLI